MTFHGRSASSSSASRPRMTSTTTIISHHEPGHLAHAPHESPWVVTMPLIAAGDSVDPDRLPHGRRRCCSAASSATRSASPMRTTCSASTQGEFARRAARWCCTASCSRRSGSRSPASRSRPMSTCSTRALPTRRKRALQPICDALLEHKYWFDEALSGDLRARRRCARSRPVAGGDVGVIDGIADRRHVGRWSAASRARCAGCSPAICTTMHSR